MYADTEYYFNTYHGSVLSPETAERYLSKASEQIDILTFNRIVRIGFDRLTPFQQDRIRKVACLHADFLLQNEDMLQTYLARYSINSVSMEFGSNKWNLVVNSGVAMDSTTYAILMATGLCTRAIV